MTHMSKKVITITISQSPGPNSKYRKETKCW
nr:MAG TPA: hypothetical protein [Caudoviricetes sp.]